MIRNGLDVEKLTGMVDAIRNDPGPAALRFTVHSVWRQPGRADPRCARIVPHGGLRRELHDYVKAHSPIWDTLAKPVRVESRLEEPAGN
jgi:hypothetical protein